MEDKKYNDDEYKEIRHIIEKTFYSEKDLDKSLKLTKDFLSLITKNEVSEYNYHFTYMMFSKIYNNKNQKKKALYFVKLSKKYLRKYKNVDTLTAENLWQFAMCCKDEDDEKALRYFDFCYNFCELKKLRQHMAGISDEIGVMTNDAEAIKLAIAIYSNLNNLDEEYKQNSLDTMYEHLFNVYMYNGDIENAQSVIHNVHNQDLNKNLKLRFIRLA